MPSDRPMDVLVEAGRLGFRIGATQLGGLDVWAWHRGCDTAWPYFGTKDEALAWMKVQIRRGMLLDR